MKNMKKENYPSRTLKPRLQTLKIDVYEKNKFGVQHLWKSMLSI